MVAHLGLLVAIVIQGLVLPSRTVPKIPLLRVDLVALPDLTQQEIKNIQKPAQKAPAPALKSKDRVANALARIRALRDASETRDQETPHDTKVMKGNAVTKGQSLSEHARETGEASYLDVIRDKLEANFAIPVWLKRLDPKARILLQITVTGSVLRLTFIESSGQPEYDRIVRQTVEDAEPFPAPDASIADRVADEGIVIDFPLR